jgi:hypothetical protein
MNAPLNIRRVSTCLQYGCYGVMLLMAGAAVFFVWKFHTAPADVLPLYPTAYQSILERFARVNGISAVVIPLLTAMPMVLVIYSYWRLSRMFVLFRPNTWFTEASASHLFVFASIHLLVQLLATPLVGVADLIPAVSLGEPIYGMPLIINNGDELTDLIAFGTLMTVSWIIREGTRLAEENAEFI